MRGGWVACLLVASIAPMTAWAQQAPNARVTYMRSFKASDPAFIQVTVSEGGQASFTVREKAGDAPTTLNFTASAAVQREVFQEAAALHDFSRPRLQSPAQVAYTGDKSLAYDDVTQHAMQQFTFTTVGAAAELQALFEKIAVSGWDAVRLERAMQYQPLDVLDALDQIEQDRRGGQLAEAQILTPALAAAAGNPALMEAARRRAAALQRALKGAGDAALGAK